MQVPDTENVASRGPSSFENSALQAKLDLIQKQLELVTAKLAKGKGRGKKSKPAETEPPPPGQRTGLFNRLRTSLSGPSTSRDNLQDCPSDQASVSSISVADDEQPPPSYSDVVDRELPRGTKEKTIYIKNVQLLLNGVGLDQIETNETEGKNLSMLEPDRET